MRSSSRSAASSVLAVAAAAALIAAPASAQYNQTRNLTPDGYWHNRYHQLLSMAAYGDYSTTCPIQTFTQAEKIKNFPNSQRPPWTILEEWSTPTGCQGFSAIVPEMNKVLFIFRGNHQREQNLPQDVVPWSAITPGLGQACPSCTANRYAVQGYLEARNATNNWQITRNAYYNAGLVFSITGHGLGGMHALIASVDYNQQDIAWYSHNYGTPRTFNPAGVNWYNQRFNGEAGERGIFADDTYVNSIPSGPNYAHAGTTFYYWGTNSTNGNPNWQICWDDQDGTDPACQPGAQVSNTLNTTPEMDHYFYWANVGECGGQNTIDTSIVNSFLNSSAALSAGQPFTNSKISAAVSYASSIYSGPYYYGSTQVPSTTSAYYAPTSSSTPYYYAPASSSTTFYVQTRTSTRYQTSYVTPTYAAASSSSRGY